MTMWIFCDKLLHPIQYEYGPIFFVEINGKQTMRSWEEFSNCVSISMYSTKGEIFKAYYEFCGFHHSKDFFMLLWKYPKPNQGKNACCYKLVVLRALRLYHYVAGYANYLKPDKSSVMIMNQNLKWLLGCFVNVFYALWNNVRASYAYCLSIIRNNIHILPH